MFTKRMALGISKGLLCLLIALAALSVTTHAYARTDTGYVKKVYRSETGYFLGKGPMYYVYRENGSHIGTISMFDYQVDNTKDQARMKLLDLAFSTGCKIIVESDRIGGYNDFEGIESITLDRTEETSGDSGCSCEQNTALLQRLDRYARYTYYLIYRIFLRVR